MLKGFTGQMESPGLDPCLVWFKTVSESAAALLTTLKTVLLAAQGSWGLPALQTPPHQFKSFTKKIPASQPTNHLAQQNWGLSLQWAIGDPRPF